MPALLVFGPICKDAEYAERTSERNKKRARWASKILRNIARAKRKRRLSGVKKGGMGTRHFPALPFIQQLLQTKQIMSMIFEA